VATECNEMCSFWNSEAQNEYSFLQNRACGDGGFGEKIVFVSPEDKDF
jgi:hypothetical protein